MNIFVSNLSFSTTSESLQELFAAHGEVTSAKVITDRETGRSRGFGFVEMSDDAEGQNAISALNETDFEGKTIGVNVARPKTGKSGGGYNSRGGNGGYNSRKSSGGGYGRNRY
ncbi:MAG: RNA-binding protein [Prevotellaceae bacterium]|jgi:RNA recognition motif-containing protein|nr:RNA-binding protein [Prevotellaceae bacterium]